MQSYCKHNYHISNCDFDDYGTDSYFSLYCHCSSTEKEGSLLVAMQCPLCPVLVIWNHSHAACNLGWGRVGYHRAGWACTYDWSYNMAYNVIIFTASQVLTSVIMVYCYFKIFWVFRQSKKRVAGANPKVKEKSAKNEEIRLAIQFLVVFAIYNICWGPYFVVSLMIDPLGLLPPWVYGSFSMAVLWNSAVNILVYIYYNRYFVNMFFNCSAYARLEQLLVAQNHKIQLVPQQKVIA